MIKRVFYIAYYFKKLDKPELKKFMDYVMKKKKISKINLWKKIIGSSLKYNISILEYFLFKFYEISDSEKKTYAGTGYMYEYQLKMNPRKHRELLENKLLFLKEYASFIKHKYASLNEIKEDSVKLHKILNNDSGKIVLKSATGQCGIGIEVRKSKEFSKETLIDRLIETDNDFVEDFVQQHQKLNELSPSGLNTIRVITQLTKNNKVEILGARLRITINSSIDNLAAGNIAAPINIETGKVEGAGVYSDITKKDENIHPITKVKIIDFQIPFWKETIEMVTAAAILHTDNKSIGWDVAITDNGPELIEGNHDWCKLLWQLPVKKGLKPILEKYN